MWDQHTLTARDLSFHCPADVDYHRVTLPEPLRECLTLGAECATSGEDICPELTVTTNERAAVSVELFSTSEVSLAPAASVVELSGTAIPRSFYVKVTNRTRRVVEYDLFIEYKLPVSEEEVPPAFRDFDEWTCCALFEMRDCRPEPGGSTGGGLIGFDLIDLARIPVETFFEFDAFCPDIVCQRPPTEYHLVDLTGAGGNLSLDMVAEDGFRQDIEVALAGMDFAEVAFAQALPASEAGAGGGAGGAPEGFGALILPALDGDPTVWRLEVPDLKPGLYALRIRGLESGEVYSLLNPGPRPPLEPTNPPAAPEDFVAVAVAGAVELSWRDVSSLETGYELERLDLVSGEYVLIASLPADAESHVDTGVTPGQVHTYALRAVNEHGESPAAVFQVLVPLDRPRFHRADPNADGKTDITDAIATFAYLFLGGAEPGCRESADTNNDGKLDLTDGIVVLQFLFLGGSAPAAPGPATAPCGEDPDPQRSAGDLGCESYAPCSDG